jgi:O-antigen/teichoic acid export membrane protein
MGETQTAAQATIVSRLSGDTKVALRNAVKLTLSLIATWSIGLVVRFWLPRHLGPENFGLLSFADGLAATVLGLATLGMDTYIQKEIPIRPASASGFFGGSLLLRSALSALLIAGLMVAPMGTQPPQIRVLLVAYGFGYLVFSINGSLAALLQANATVDELARANVGTKIAWGAGMFAGILTGMPLVGFGLVLLLSETLKTTFLLLAARRRLGLELRLDAAATKVALAASMGFYASNVAHTLGQRIDLNLLGFLAQDADVGWYSASQTLASITLLLSPVLSAVLMPLYARSLHRSKAEMLSVMRRALQGVVAVATPVALMLALGAELWIGIAFGSRFAPAAGSLRTLAPNFLLVYVSILLATGLVAQGRGWTLTLIALMGVGVNSLMGILLAPIFGSWYGAGGVGMGMAFATVTRECFVSSCMLMALGRGTIDRGCWSMLGRTALAAAVTIVAHLAMAPLGPWRLIADVGVYAAVAVGVGALRPRDLVALATEFMPRKGAATP